MFGGIPFESFAGGGFPGGGMGGMGGPPKDVDTTKLYETLEVSKDADQKEIKKAYRKLSRIHHPDKGGDEHKFKEINAAYEILSDEDKRKAYDQYGLEGVSDDGHPGNMHGEDLFSMFFGGGGRSRSSGPRKGPSVNHPIKVSLEDLYKGKTVKLAVNRKVIVGEVKDCTGCNGQGSKMEVRQIGPGMIQQLQRPCNDCNGRGSTAKTKSERKVLEVHIEPGMRHNEKITFRGMADELPKQEPGDINFIINEKEHDTFKRKGADLLITKELSLNQALCGFAHHLTQLDGRKLVIKTRPGEVIKPESTSATAMPYVKMIPDEGMPSRGNPFVRGNLYILFRVVFPDDNDLSPETIATLKSILPNPDMDIDHDAEDVEEVNMKEADVREFGKGGAEQGPDRAYDSDDEDGRPVQCQQS